MHCFITFYVCTNLWRLQYMCMLTLTISLNWTLQSCISVVIIYLTWKIWIYTVNMHCIMALSSLLPCMKYQSAASCMASPGQTKRIPDNGTCLAVAVRLSLLLKVPADNPPHPPNHMANKLTKKPNNYFISKFIFIPNLQMLWLLSPYMYVWFIRFWKPSKVAFAPVKVTKVFKLKTIIYSGTPHGKFGLR